MTDFAFIDSGVGGIPYMMELRKKEPSASCIYVADNANFPYGEKSHDQVIACVTAVVEKICKKFEPSVIVLACNTISVNALETLRKAFPKVKFVGTVPAIKLAASVSQKKRIGLLASSSTCENPYNIELKNKFASDCELVMRPDAELISFIEKNGFTATDIELENAVRPAIDFFAENGCDVIILGCTHFLNIKSVFEKVALREPQGPHHITIVDSVDGVVRQMIKVRDEMGALSFGSAQDKLAQEPHFEPLLYTTSDDTNEQSKYEAICSHFNIAFGGKI